MLTALCAEALIMVWSDTKESVNKRTLPLMANEVLLQCKPCRQATFLMPVLRVNKEARRMSVSDFCILIWLEPGDVN
jgi:hypothetical protein